MIVSALVDVLELAGLMVGALGVDAIKEEALNLVRGIQRITIPGKLLISEILQNAAYVARVMAAILVNHLAKHKDLARTENVGWRPIKRAPIKSQAKIALPLRGETANRGSVEREVVVALHQKLFVVVEHMRATFEVREQHGHSLDARRVGEILQPLFLDDIGSHTIPSLLLRPQVQLFQLLIRQLQKVTKFGRHGTPSLAVN